MANLVLGFVPFSDEFFLPSDCVHEFIAARPCSPRSSHVETLDASERVHAGRAAAWPPSLSFLATQRVPPGLLLEALDAGRRSGVNPVAALLANGAISEEDYYRALARNLGVPFDDGEIPLGGGLAYPETIHAGVAPALFGGVAGWLIAPAPQQVDQLIALARHGRLPSRRIAITTPSLLSHRVREQQGATVARRASTALMEKDASLSARTPSTVAQKTAGAMLGFLLPFAIVFGGLTWSVLSLAFSIVLASAILLRILATAASCEAARKAPPRLADHELPHYTVAVALYREADIAARLVRALDAIDYPSGKLEIKIVVEHDDHHTIAALQALRLPARYEIVVAPGGVPRTKPRALNVALPLARGSLLAIFDAEDRPEPQQLRKAAEQFAASSPKVACLQGILVIDNVRDSWLTRCFAIEYAALFDVLNPGLAQLRVPLPLGGTTNHFRVAALRDVAGWDAWNVTEDIDLGLRLARLGYRIDVLPVVTDEEAPADAARWLRQRRRWLKGWLQTLMTHSRTPKRLVRELGLLPACATMTLVASGFLGPLLGPLFGGFAMLDAIYGSLLQPSTLAEALASTCWVFVGTAGALSVFWPAVLGIRRRGLERQTPCLLMLPLYYMLLSAAAWAALIDFFRAPHHWHKTDHGLARTSRHMTPAD